MQVHNQIQEVYKTASNYPDLVKKLIAIGIASYTVEVSTKTILYRFSNGELHLQPGGIEPLTIAKEFNEQNTIQTIRNNQQGKTDYLGFINEIANAGVRFYEATLNGINKRVTYIGFGGFYEEAISVKD